MKFGLLHELQLPKPWPEDAELRLFHEALDQVRLADERGFDYAWQVEHAARPSAKRASASAWPPASRPR